MILSHMSVGDLTLTALGKRIDTIKMVSSLQVEHSISLSMPLKTSRIRSISFKRILSQIRAFLRLHRPNS